MAKTNIDWCDEVWNPVYGCLKGCPYCYARKYAKRFYKKMGTKEAMLWKDRNRLAGATADRWAQTFQEKLKAFTPFWLESNFRREFPKKPKRIFVNSMSDINFWEPEWMAKVLNRIRENPQHTFMFLTKFWKCYAYFKVPENCILGITINGDKRNEINKIVDFASTSTRRKFVSIEPINGRLAMRIIYDLKLVDWIIIGAETGNRKGKVIPKREWIQNIVDFCRENKIPVFLKGSLKDIWKDKLIQEWPEWK